MLQRHCYSVHEEACTWTDSHMVDLAWIVDRYSYTQYEVAELPLKVDLQYTGAMAKNV